MKNRSPHSLIFKVVVFQLLLFAIFFLLINIYPSRLELSQLLLLLFFASFLITGYFAITTSRAIHNITDTVERISRGDFYTDSDEASSKEIAELSEIVAKLGKNIQISQDNLENQHNQLNGILAYMTDGVIATDRRGKVILANPAALQLLATTSEQILTKNIAEALSIDNYYAFRDLLERTPDISINSKDADGEHIRLRVNFSIFRRESGYISGIVAVLHDITESEKLEREQQLFVSNVSHELRTPLTTIKSYLETLNDGALQDPTVAKDFVSVTLNETDHMIQMVNDILALSRIDMKRTVLQKELVNVSDFITHTVDRFKQMIKTDEIRGITFQTNLPQEDVWTELDTSKINQVIDNILTNAVKYSPHGGKVTVSLETNERQLLIKISDQGMGIPPQDLTRIFDRFYRVDKSRTHDSGGTGLGLSIAYDIVKLHGGTIGVKSDGQHGTEFAIILPYEPMTFDDDDFAAEEDDLTDSETTETASGITDNEISAEQELAENDISLEPEVFDDAMSVESKMLDNEILAETEETLDHQDLPEQKVVKDESSDKAETVDNHTSLKNETTDSDSPLKAKTVDDSNPFISEITGNEISFEAKMLDTEILTEPPTTDDENLTEPENIGNKEQIKPKTVDISDSLAFEAVDHRAKINTDKDISESNKERGDNGRTN